MFFVYKKGYSAVTKITKAGNFKFTVLMILLNCLINTTFMTLKNHVNFDLGWDAYYDFF